MLRSSRMQKIEGSAPTVVNRDFGSTRTGSFVTHPLAAAGGQSLVATARAGAQRIQVALMDDEPRNVTHGSAVPKHVKGKQYRRLARGAAARVAFAGAQASLKRAEVRAARRIGDDNRRPRYTFICVPGGW